MTRKPALFLSLILLIVLGLSACAPKATEQPPAPPEPLPTEPPPAEPPPSEPPPLTEAPIELAGPSMEVGSKYTYVDGSLLVAVPAGEFIMGHGEADNPEHVVFLDDFWIYRGEVTNNQYARCVETGNCAPPDPADNTAYGDPRRANDPVVGVNYDQAVSYCEFVDGRLPTEAEWEKTARGPQGNIYPWGEEAPSCDLLNAGNCMRKTTDVTTYPPGMSFYEAFDMAGNVWEWVADWYSPTYYGESPSENPFGPEAGQKRSVRSSGFNAAFFETDVSRRFSAKPDDHRSDLGFRCVIMDPLHFAPYCEYLTVYGMNNGIDPLSNPDIQVDCPVLGISQSKFCGDNDTPLTNVQFSYPSSWPVVISIPGAPTCIDAGGDLYTCNAIVPVSICADCNVTVNEDPQCPPGYHLAGLTCLPDNLFPGECLPGVNYDPENQCCSTQALTGGVSPPCPPGTYYYNPPGGCFAAPGAPVVCKNDTVALKSCTSDGGGCNLTAASCGNNTFDPGRCCCVSATSGQCLP